MAAGRLYLCPIIGDGTPSTIDPVTGVLTNNAFRASIADIPNLDYNSPIATIESGPDRGKPKYAWTICSIATSDWAAIDGRSDVILLADIEAGGPEALDDAPDTELLTKVRAMGALTRSETDALTTKRTLVRALVQKHSPQADEVKQFPSTRAR